VTAISIPAIEEFLRGFGWQPEPPKVSREFIDKHGEVHDGADSFCKELNQKLLQNLDAWVPNLKYVGDMRRTPSGIFRGKALWRESTTGKTPEQRSCNLSFSRGGIKDFGTGEGLTPLNVIMRDHDCSLFEACELTRGWLGIKDEGPEVDFDAVLKSPQVESPSIAPLDGPSIPKHMSELAPAPPASIGEVWCCGDPVPAQKPMLVPGLLPLKGFGILGGQWGTFKTFVTDDLAIAVASGGKFGGQQVTTEPMAVVQIELEGSNSEVRLSAAAAARGLVAEDLPILHIKTQPPNIMTNGRPNPAWNPWSESFVKFAREFAAFRGVPLGLITIDPQNSIAGFKDEDSSAEGQIVSNAAWKMTKGADCLVLFVDHLGKNAEAGLRGTSAKETNPLVILSTGETKEDVYCDRTLTVRKMRNGRSGMCVDFRMEDFNVTLDQIVENADGAPTGTEPITVKTLVIKWSEELRPVGQEPSWRERDWPNSVRDLKEAMNDAMADAGFDYSGPGSGGHMVKAVDLEVVRPIFYRRRLTG
jgi:AAA domain-containing protein